MGFFVPFTFLVLLVIKMTVNKPKLIFMGTPNFARIILEKIHDSGFYDIVAVYAQPDKPVGRGGKLSSPPVAVFAKSHNLTLKQPIKIREPQVLGELKAFEADIIVVAAYGKILPREALTAARVDCLNVHASLLPKYRGAAPINHAILNDEKQTGVAIMRVVEALDAGPVYAERALLIGEDEDASTLTEKLAHLGVGLLLETLPAILNGEKNPCEQNSVLATYASKLDKTLSPINWNRPAREIFNQIRALVPWPVAETALNGKRIKVYRSRPLTEFAHGRPGEIVHIGKLGWTVAAKDHNILITDVQLEGKKRMSASDLANGLRLSVGAVLS